MPRPGIEVLAEFGAHHPLVQRSQPFPIRIIRGTDNKPGSMNIIFNRDRDPRWVKTTEAFHVNVEDFCNGLVKLGLLESFALSDRKPEKWGADESFVSASRGDFPYDKLEMTKEEFEALPEIEDLSVVCGHELYRRKINGEWVLLAPQLESFDDDPTFREYNVELVENT